MIVISNSFSIPNEHQIIQQLFEEGLALLHIRKPDFSEQEMRLYLSKIKLEHRTKLVVHQHHYLSDEFHINRIHFTEKEREKLSGSFKKSFKSLSTSVHSIKDFNSLSTIFDYAFLSPIYSSISKENYAPIKNPLEEIKKRTNYNTKLIALGGISSENMVEILKYGFDNVALLGTIWNSNNPIENFKKCKQFVLSF